MIPRTFLAPLTVLAVLTPSAPAINILVDYTYDTNNFFSSQARRDAMQAVANRFSNVITSSLQVVNLTDNGTDGRIGFNHPGTGAAWEVSAAAGAGSDAILGAGGGAASEYRNGINIAANTWILYAGGRAIGGGVAGQGGTGTGTNFTSVTTDPNSHLSRGFNAAPTNSSLPVWGGSITFDTGTTWHFDPGTAAAGADADFYTVALHEVGHALGLSVGFTNWTNHVSGSTFTGPLAVAAYNADNGAALGALNMTSAANFHWQDGTYDSRIFAEGSPNYVGTVGAGNLQDLLMEPTLNLGGAIRRMELTNVDVGALRDVGWSVVPEPSAALLGLAAAGAGLTRRRRSTRA